MRVCAVEAAHRRQLIEAGVLSPATMLLSGSAFPRSVCIGDVCVDDLLLICLTHCSLKHAAEADARMQAADEFFKELECPARSMTFGEVKLTVCAVRLVSSWVSA